MDPKKTPSGPEKRDNAPLQANNAPLLSNEKEEIIARLKNVDINGDGIADGPAEKKMLDWTINEIRKTCGNLPAEKLRLLIERISKVMMERSVQQSRIQQEVARESSALKQEVDVAQEKKSPSKATFTDRLFKIAQDHTDIRLRSKGLIDDIWEISMVERIELEKRIENDNHLFSVLVEGWKNDKRWRDKIEKEHPSSYIILMGLYDKLVKKYDIKIENGDPLSFVRSKVDDAKTRTNALNQQKGIADQITKTIGGTRLGPLVTKIQKLSKDADTVNPMIFLEINDLGAEISKIAKNIRASLEFRDLNAIADKTNDPVIKEKIRVFNIKLAELEAMATALAWAWKIDLATTERRVNRLTELASKVKSSIAAIERGELLVESFSKLEGNTAKSLEQFEADIVQKMAAGGPANVNAQGFSEYLLALHSQKKLNHKYLQNKGFLSQFGLHWQINTSMENNTKTQEILRKTPAGVEALAQFKKVIWEHMRYAFDKETIQSGKTFNEVSEYIKRQGIDSKESAEILDFLASAKGNGVLEFSAVESRIKQLQHSNNNTIRELATRAYQGYSRVQNVAKVEANGATNNSISHFIKSIHSPTLADDLSRGISEIAKSKKLNQSGFTTDLKFDELIKHPPALAEVKALLEKNAARTTLTPEDRTKLQSIIKYLAASNPAENIKTIATEKQAQKAVAKVVDKIGPSANISTAVKKLSASKDMAQLSKNIENATAVRIETEEQQSKMEKTPVGNESYRKIISILGLDPDEVTMEALKADPALTFEVMRRMGILDNIEKKLTPNEQKEFEKLRSMLALIVSKDLQVRGQFGTVNSFHKENDKELVQNHAGIAEQKASMMIYDREATEITYSTLTHAKEFHSPASGQPIGTGVMENMPTGKFIMIDTDTKFVRGVDGSYSIVTPYSVEVIPPEKSKIAIGYISVASGFDGLGLISGLHETLQSHASNPILSKMKDGVSRHERCDLIKHFANVLGVVGYNENADTPKALMNSIRNCLPFGKSFWELAQERGLTRPDGTINPLAIGQTFEMRQSKTTEKSAVSKSEKTAITA